MSLDSWIPGERAMSCMQPHVGTLEYVVEVAKDWARARFAGAQTADFALSPHRFELIGAAVRRRAVSPASPEGQSPFDAVPRAPRPTAWAHGTTLTLLADSEAGAAQYDQEAVEILAMEGTDVLAECALVVRIGGLPPCLGSFWPAR
jgi:hypothetical protein